MFHHLTPTYLSSLVPSLVSDTSGYSLRNANNLTIPPYRTKLYAESFLPSVLHLWNSLPQSIRDCDSVSGFKEALNKREVTKPPSYYYIGSRKSQALHARLRTNSSSLNLTLFQKNLTDSPLCVCGNIESAEHFLLSCPLYHNLRVDLLNSTHPICRPDPKTLLFGDHRLSVELNTEIFTAVQHYIVKTNRFV